MDWVYFTLAVLFGTGCLYWYNNKLLRFVCASAGGFFLMLLGGVTMIQFEANAAGSLLFFVGGATWIITFVQFLVEFSLRRERKVDLAQR